MRAATPADDAFIVEMTRHACIIEDWPLLDPDDEDMVGMLPPPGVVPVLAEDLAGPSVGAAWTWHNDSPLRINAAGESIPEL